MIASQEAWNTPKKIDVFEPDHLSHKFTYLYIYLSTGSGGSCRFLENNLLYFCNSTYLRRKQEKMTFVISSWSNLPLQHWN